MSILICFALKEEAAPVQKSAAGKSGASILLTGIGRENAEKSVREFVEKNSPKFVLTCGFAGGLKPGLKIGDVVFEIPEPSTFNLQLSTRIAAAGAKPAKFFCADRIAITVAEKKKLRDETGADAVEMESAAIHKICRAKKIPCATVRVISDTANENLPLDFNAFAKPDKNLDYGKLALAIAKSPWKIIALKKLQKQTEFAAEKLADVLQKIIFP
jgi:adenosylhomocysteine nucleosidase